jgi:hypothetical protein
VRREGTALSVPITHRDVATAFGVFTNFLSGSIANVNYRIFATPHFVKVELVAVLLNTLCYVSRCEQDWPS